PDNGCHRRAEAVIEGAGQNLGGVVLAGQRLQHDDGICRGSRPRAQQCDAQPDAAPPGLAFDSPDVPHGAILPRAAAAQALSSRVAYPTAPVTRATASWACRLSKCETVTSKRATRGLVETTAATRRAASSQNMRFSALARANACSSSRFTAVCTGVPSAASMASTSSSNGSASTSLRRVTRTSARLRWACGVAAMPRPEPSHACTSTLDGAWSSAKSASKASALARRDSAAEAGQVLEYSTPNASTISAPEGDRVASTSTG